MAGNRAPLANDTCCRSTRTTQLHRVVAGLPEEAVRSYERAIRMNPVDPRLPFAFGGMGVAFIELGRFNEAIAIGKKALHQNPSYSPAYRCLASAFAHLGRDAEAREAAALGSQADMPEQNLSNLRPLTLYRRRARKGGAPLFFRPPPADLRRRLREN